MNKTRHYLIFTLMVLITATLGLAASEFEAAGEMTSTQVATAGEGTPSEAPNSDPVRKGLTAPSAAMILAALDQADRNNAIIELEATRPEPVPWALPDPVEVAALWNEGRQSEALLALQQLESAGFNFIPAISWKAPVESHQKFYYQDVRIGGVRTGAQILDLDYDSQETTIFALIGWADGWTMNVSLDGGITWQETFSYGVQAEVSMAVCGNRVWVAYSSTGSNDELRMRRFYTSNGASDSGYSYETVANINPATVVDVALIGNEQDISTAVYVGIVASDNTVRTYWDDLTGTSFSAYSPTITNADDNIDFTYAPYGLYSSGYVAYLSYESTAGDIVVWRMSVLGTWDQILSRPITGSQNYTSISAYEDTVMVVYEYGFTNGNGIRYEVSYNYGTGWAYGNLYNPAAGDPAAHGGAISLSGGNGSFVTYNLEEGTTDHAWLRSRPGYGSFPWNDPLWFSNFDTMSATETKIEWIGTLCVGSHGMLYLAADGIPYFDITSPRGFFCDGFESGGTSAWD